MPAKSAPSVRCAANKTKASILIALSLFLLGVNAHEKVQASPEMQMKLCQSLSTKDQEQTVAKAAVEQNYWRGPLASDLDNSDDFWQVQDPATSGINLEALHEYADLCQRTHADAYLVVYKGKIVGEGYAKGYVLPMATMSSVKSITALLVGMLVADGKIASIDDPVWKYIPQWKDGNRTKVTIRQLLTMTSGLKRRFGDQGPDASVGTVSDKNSHVIALALSYEPGTKWEYSNEGAQLLSPILDKAAGIPIQEYAKTRLFEPLGMKQSSLHVDEKNHAWTYADANTTLRDFARIGMLMMNHGQWQGKQIVPASWVNDCLQSSPQKHNYGYLWWLYDSPHGFGTKGYRDTDIYCFPELELVVARMQNTPSDESPTYTSEALAIFAKMLVPRKH